MPSFLKKKTILLGGSFSDLDIERLRFSLSVLYKVLGLHCAGYEIM